MIFKNRVLNIDDTETTKSFFKELKDNIKGEVYDDAITCSIYSIDASIYEVKPLGVAFPRDKEDLIQLLKIAAHHKIPITARGAATGITGSCLGSGLIVDTSKYLNQIIEINIEEEYAICEPGVVQDRLNEALAPHGYRLGPDTSTGNRATLGGMLANNSAGARSLFYGRMVDHVKEVELALSGGELLHFKAISNEEWIKKRQQDNREGVIYKTIFKILNSHREAIQKSFPKIPRHVSGYNLDMLLTAPPLNVCNLITGSEGTLGIATQIKVKIAKKTKLTGICILHLHDMISAMRMIGSMLAHRPIALEMIDNKILSSARNSPAVCTKLAWLIGNPEAVFVAEFEAATHEALDAKLQDFSNAMQSLNIGYANVILTHPQEIAAVWEVRKAGLGLLLSKRSYSRAIAFIEDISIAPNKLPDFMADFCQYLKSIGKDAGIYGHIGSGCMHIRPYIDLRKKEETARMQEMMKDISSMVLNYGGAMSGEHGDGLVRSWLNEKMFGKELYNAFKDLKAAFDPDQLMNPGKIVDGPPLTENLKLSPQSKNLKIPTLLDFSSEGGFELAVDMCNGNGQCRKKENVMCPSFQVSGEEYHTTRARAQTLRSIIHGKLPLQELTGEGLYEVLDLCIECKGCKKECPSQVDMAKMKSEILYQYQERHGYSLRNHFFSSLHRLNQLSSPFAKIINHLSSTFIAKTILSWIGVAPQRKLPQLAQEKFSTWFEKQKPAPKAKKLILFNDTYTEFNEPSIGRAAYHILSALGYQIILANGYCCGRPLISKGFLKEAKENASNLIKHLNQLNSQNLPIIILEPSCVSAFIDDYKGLLGHQEKSLYTFTDHLFSFEEFLQKHLENGILPIPFQDKKYDVWVHGHCHQKALISMIPTIEILKSIPGFTVHEIDSGCCGMAGSFGYEKEHYDFSMKIGNLKLFPTLHSVKNEDLIIASGMSCRSQIHDGTHRHAIHLAEAIYLQTRLAPPPPKS